MTVSSNVLDASSEKAPPVDQKMRAASESAQANDTAVDQEIEKRVDEERVATGADDLLNEEAPKEFGGH